MKNRRLCLPLLSFAILMMTLSVVPGSASAHAALPSAARGAGATWVGGSSAASHAASMLRAAGGDAPTGLDALHPPLWDEQMGLTFSDNLSSLHLNVTATAQADQYGYGPGYLLNGLTEKGFWYQVGISWQWPMTSGGHATGFSMDYEVFSSAQSSVFPSQGSGLDPFNGQVSSGDIVLLSLNFSGGNVTMAAYDWNSTASAHESYSARGAVTFLGLNSTTNPNGFFSGPMTEWWHASAYLGGENQTQYTDAVSQKSSAWMWADEWAPGNGSVVFEVDHFASFSNATAMTYLGYLGCQMAANAFVFLTGGLLQAPTTLSYSVSGGGGGYGAPVLAYWSNATQVSANLSTTPSVYYIDLNSVWTVNSSLPGTSDVEAWRTSQITSHTESVIMTYDFAYYHQFRITFGLEVVGGTGYSPFTVPATQFGSPFPAPTGLPVFVDAQSSFTYPNPLPGSGVNERWSTTDPVTGFVTGSVSVRPTYYDQLSVAPSYAVQGGAGVSSPPQLISQRYGGSVSLTLTTSPAQTWLDRGAPWNVNDTLMGSGPTERWQTTQLTQGVLSPAQAMSFTYYHQFLVNASYAVFSGSPTLPVAGWPLLNGTQFGSAVTTSLNGNPVRVWLDGGTPWSVSDASYSAGATQRLATGSPTTGVVSDATVVAPVFYVQYLFAVSYAVNGGGNPAAPSLNYTNLGTRLNVSLSSTASNLWLDAQSAYSLTPELSASSGERWTTGGDSTAFATGAMNLTVSYAHQFHVTVTTNANGGGTALPLDGWANAGQAVALTASASPGWSFERWEGTGVSAYSGNLSSTAVTAGGPIMEDAIFYPSLTISATGSGSVSYSSPSASGSVAGGGRLVVYVPPGENVTLRAQPSYFSQFDGWSPSNGGSASGYVVSVQAPSEVAATFGVSWIYVLLVVAAVAAVGGVLFLLFRHRDGEKRSTKASAVATTSA